ncbi:M23 family metallopeptidase [Pacificimonas flava]|uniref:Peptidase M23B n=1 Tax=Pacificimonas flava TaxID=1234595 RepID=M2T8U2_9SPHN|nr:M23 family metallopeptidase [Pacificimonas flava]EMD82914.1 peptidase M23B [Pacificimonas flava]MBB5280076.1 murein DD-endopeptidase MepM/ murein hydrolase activator NlpD [Pacificimonas flava]
MTKSVLSGAQAAFRKFFTDRELMHYSERTGMQVLRLTAKKQLLFAAGVFGLFSYSAAMTGIAVAGPGDAPTAAERAELAQMQAQVAQLQDEVAEKAAALEARQDMLAEVLVGEEGQVLGSGDETETAGLMGPLNAVEQRQFALAELATDEARARFDARRAHLEKLGLPEARFTHAADLGMGGPEVEVGSAEADLGGSDARFKELFLSWKRLDTLEKEMSGVPKRKPVQKFTYTSGYGVRLDPFRGTTKMHTGVDMAGPVGETVVATGAGEIIRAGWTGGYGKMVEIDHGKGLTTRYAHMSKINVKTGDRVGPGETIGAMGSTGRSTGSHLHYEVRLDGRAVNPMPFLETMDVAVREDTSAIGGE